MIRIHIVIAIAATLLLVACDGRKEGTYQGYAEGEYVRVGPIDGGTIDAIPVKRGDKVAEGALLFQLDATAEIAAQAQASAQLAQTRSQYEDLLKGLRVPELEQIEASRSSAAATLKKTQFDFTRAEKLYADGNVSKSALDTARAARDAAAASVRELDAKLVTGKLSARPDQVAAAEAAVKAAQAALDQANWRLSRREGHTPQGGTVEDVFFRVGEFASATQPIVSVLPPQNIKIRFFVPEPELGRIHVGDTVALTCDGCPAGLTGHIRFISTQAEFTPPVIYSEQSQAKLVYMAEAWPDKSPEDFHPGQPVRVSDQTAE
ncbi:HlyD family efflux transporter periplasmic adaptor subunit [Parvibaculum sedimenti]|uniref:HlyD family efflux transporter periplasmic adaptor subunit n=1 Tax=Parvibaculum sedimenti TaxID=2608632 RepID=A0A6N6VDY1_9HYPH|nr:HlyD family efflux transporter periplasmic adaptor subunit [Parvibaculum sedimenti]KAB7738928.1 HlyD family efflux transporter periplasmic adaptor subunit [Parvibaculum sedimenti]